MASLSAGGAARSPCANDCAYCVLRVARLCSFEALVGVGVWVVMVVGCWCGVRMFRDQLGCGCGESWMVVRVRGVRGAL